MVWFPPFLFPFSDELGKKKNTKRTLKHIEYYDYYHDLPRLREMLLELTRGSFLALTSGFKFPTAQISFLEALDKEENMKSKINGKSAAFQEKIGSKITSTPSSPKAQKD